MVIEKIFSFAGNDLDIKGGDRILNVDGKEVAVDKMPEEYARQAQALIAA